MKFGIKDFIPFIILLLPFLFLSMVWDKIPETVTAHYNLYGEADGFTDKPKFPFILLLPVIIISLMIIFFKAIEGSIDDKKEKISVSNALFYVSVVLSVFISLLLILIIYQTIYSNSIPIGKLIGAGILLLVGTIMRLTKNILPNAYVGIKTKWTMNNAEIWKRTHEFCGSNVFYLYLAGAALSLLLPEHYAIFFSIAWLLVMMFSAIYYSYWLHQKFNSD
jgi:uncharacterized membrane protein